MSEIFKDDIGTVIEVTIKKEDGTAYNLTPVADVYFMFKKPDGTVITKKKSLGELVYQSAENGIVTFTTTSGFWAAGGWTLSVKVIDTAGAKEYVGTAISINVYNQFIK